MEVQAWFVNFPKELESLFMGSVKLVKKINFIQMLIKN